MRNIENPFKFGTIVEEEYFTDRIQEVEKETSTRSYAAFVIGQALAIG